MSFVKFEDTFCRKYVIPNKICETKLIIYAVDYVVIGFDMEVQPLVTHNSALALFA